jgi:heme/copper-type cytochrome/quinol oxidase subunit 4
MKKKDIYTLVLLILLTLITAIISVNYNNFKIIPIIILGLGGVKFLLVSFQFMELKKANSFWKILISTILFVIIGIISMLL